MDCDRLREVLIDHVDGLLGRDEAEAARSHLAACADCRLLQEEVRRNFAALDAWEDEDLPAGAYDRLVQRLPAGPAPRLPVPANEAAPRARRWVRLAVPYAAGLATAAVAVGVFVLPRGGAPAAPAVPASALPAAAPVPASASLRPGERALVFRDPEQGVIRRLFVPAGVDPGNLELLPDEAPAVSPAGLVR